MMKPISIFWSDESPGCTRSAQLACSTTEHRLRGHSVCALGIHPIKKSKWVSLLGMENLAFQKFAAISMMWWPPLTYLGISEKSLLKYGIHLESKQNTLLIFRKMLFSKRNFFSKKIMLTPSLQTLKSLFVRKKDWWKFGLFLTAQSMSKSSNFCYSLSFFAMA